MRLRADSRPEAAAEAGRAAAARSDAGSLGCGSLRVGRLTAEGGLRGACRSMKDARRAAREEGDARRGRASGWEAAVDRAACGRGGSGSDTPAADAPAAVATVAGTGASVLPAVAVVVAVKAVVAGLALAVVLEADRAEMASCAVVAAAAAAARMDDGPTRQGLPVASAPRARRAWTTAEELCTAALTRGVAEAATAAQRGSGGGSLGIAARTPASGGGPALRSRNVAPRRRAMCATGVAAFAAQAHAKRALSPARDGRLEA